MSQQSDQEDQQLNQEELEQLQAQQQQLYQQQQLGESEMEQYQQQYQQQQEEEEEEGDFEEEEGQHVVEIDGKQIVLNSEQYAQLLEQQGMLQEGSQEQGEEGEGEEQEGNQEFYDSDAELYEDDDELRKIRRDLLDNLNKERKARNMEPMYPELLSNMVANRYAQFLVDSEHNQQYFSQLLEKQHNFQGDYHLCYIQANYEVDVVKDKNYIFNYFMEMGYLFLEDQNDKQHILNPEINHIGLGVSLDKDKIVIVLILSTKALAILQVYNDQQGFKIRGKILKGQEKDKVQKDQGLFAVKVVKQIADSLKEEGRGSGPDKIQYNRNTKEFIVNMDQHELDPISQRCEKYLEFYTRLNPDSIPYGKKSRDSEKPISYKYLEFQLRIPSQPYPDPKYAQEDEADRLRQQEEQEREYQEQLRQQELEQQKINEAMREQEGQFSDENEEDSDDNKDEDEDEDEDEDMQMRQEQKEPVISNKEIREDLERAINEAMIQHKEFMDQNLLLQQRIKQLRSRNEMYVERQNEMAMNDHKYLNTLAHVHQIRLDLQQTQKNYNMMSRQLQEKLEAKQKKCNEIKLAFMELKRQVCQKAAYSRNDKPIPEKLITEWEEKEIEKDKILQELRLDNLRLRNTLIKNQKVLKKKEELAEGLHLIDFEQLKIENQTLNEKIEERNEDLHKLKKKNTNTVQILTHTKEKLKFVLAEKEKKIKQEEELNKILGEARGKLKLLKKEKQQTLDQVLKYKQITGIAKSTTLTNDFNKLKVKVEELEKEKERLKQKHNQMKDDLVRFENYKLKDMQMSQQGGMY